MQNKEDKWQEDNLTSFLYALQGEITSKGTPCKVEYFSHPEYGNKRYKNIVGVSILTQDGQDLYEIWQTHNLDIYWDKYQNNPMQGFNFSV